MSPSTRLQPNSSGVAKRWTYLVVALAFMFILMPYLLWQSTWFGRPLSDAEMQKDLTDTGHPRQMQHALSQIADRILRGDAGVRRWYPQVVHLAGSDVEQVRLTVAWLMGQDNTIPEFHEALLRLLADPQPMVRGNAALALVRFADPSGRPQLVALLKPFPLAASHAGMLSQRLHVGETVNPGTLIGRVIYGKEKIEIRSAVPGSIGNWAVADGTAVAAGQTIAWLSPDPTNVWEALRALYLVGQPADLPSILPYARGVEGMPPRIQKQAILTASQIRSRSGS